MYFSIRAVDPCATMHSFEPSCEAWGFPIAAPEIARDPLLQHLGNNVDGFCAAGLATVYLGCLDCLVISENIDTSARLSYDSPKVEGAAPFPRRIPEVK